MSFLDTIIWWEKLLEFWSEYANWLEKQDTIFQVSDFDYTLFSRDEQFEKIPELLENRWDLWPKYLFENFGMSSFIENFYVTTTIPTEIVERLDSSRDIIMTAGASKDFQLAKIRSIPALKNFTVVSTLDGEQKIPELIRYVLFSLQYIPSEIIIYEDRPEYFIEHTSLIEKTLWTKLTVMKVEMDWNSGYKSIEEV